jgi:hypothetical protein
MHDTGEERQKRGLQVVELLLLCQFLNLAPDFRTDCRES